MNVVAVVLTAIGFALLLPTGLVLLQALAATLIPRRPVSPAARPRVAVLVPAHNEASLIEKSLRSLATQMRATDRVVVIADNCTDDTARIARQIAEVAERRDPIRVGKGYALAFGVEQLKADPPDVVIVVDADCHLGPQAIDHLASLCQARGRPAQALYLMQASKAQARKGQLAAFAWLVRNYVRPLGFERLGLPCQLMGSGMAFPWSVIENARLASGSIVEDLLLGLDLASSGAAPIFVPDALVTSVFPTTDEATLVQRTRWEHGHLGVIFRLGPKLLLTSLKRRNWKLAAMVLDLCVPPLALLIMVLLTTLILSAMLAADLPLSLWTAGGATLMLFSALALSWTKFGRGTIPARAFLYAPLYLTRKIPIYARFIVRRQVEWVRSYRGPDESR